MGDIDWEELRNEAIGAMKRLPMDDLSVVVTLRMQVMVLAYALNAVWSQT
jgi:hypothetical protein